ncbi:unnamed protein product [Cylicostephanus goldi]|uniref:4-hydroxyphenylpyruvate dioxygenase n=1 Tax=Cylicostephanus goldi TaxID=71465 RepID=A0A3P6QJ10_CYLGO|nr:unnamed protein product [Cylicostephanus goldi]
MDGLADFHHVEFRVSNALQTSFWYCCCLGFNRFAIQKDEKTTAIAIRNGKAIFVIKSNHDDLNEENSNQIRVHGDAIKDIAFRVDDIDAVAECCDKEETETTLLVNYYTPLRELASIQRLASNRVEILLPKTIIQDDNGSVMLLKLQAKDSDITHTLVDDKDYHGLFLPGFQPLLDTGDVVYPRKPIPVVFVDHVVQNYPIGTIEDAAEWYKQSMALHRSIDDRITTSEYSAMKAWLITNGDQKVQMTLAEAVPGRKGRSQIEEFVKYNGGPGIQHIALLVDDIVSTVIKMRERSVEFLHVPPSYYVLLEERLKNSKVHLKEDIAKLRELCILMDFDDNGYLLQLFTKPVQDRPTLFIEIIQRRNFKGFGAGNFKALFDAVEREQRLRGTLCEET